MLAKLLIVPLLLSCPPIPESPSNVCPQVFQVGGGVAPEEGVNLLFIGHGFSEDELIKYQCAVRLLTEKLATIDPLSRAAPAINVYRIDLAIGMGMMNLQPTCNGKVCDYADTSWSDEKIKQACQQELQGNIGTAVLSEEEAFAECMLFDPDVKACPGGNSTCRVSWPSQKGFDQLWRLSNCAPNVHAIIVITDNAMKTGGGSATTFPKMIVTSMVGIDADNTRGLLLAHELGHAFGLLDEYAGNSVEVGGQLPEYHHGRNVFSTEENETVPGWADYCAETSDNLEKIHGCGVVPTGTPTENLPTVGLYEGAFYQNRKFYRAQSSCKMRNLSMKHYCAGCRAYLDKLIDDLKLPGVPAKSP